MAVLQVQLNETNSERANAAARRAGKTTDDFVNEAVERYLVDLEEMPPVADWKAALMQAAGIWKDRTDLPDFEEVRRTMDRDVWSR